MFQGAHELRAQRQARSSHPAPKVSFEFFPPSSPAIEETLWKSVARLKTLAPEFVSVTYGADGSTRDNTHRVIKALGEQTVIPTMPHLTCVDASKSEVDEVADSYWKMGVRSIMALRGDPASGAGSVYTPKADGYHYAADLVAGLKRQHDFRIGVAAYPETHPEAPSAHFDIDNLKRKFDAGADFAISQFFFSTEAYLRFRDRCVLAGIDKPIIPGILPVTNFNTLKRFAGACGTELPRWLSDSFEGLDNDPETRQLIAANIAIEQVLALQNEGVNDFHFYTLNRAELCYAVCHSLGVRPAVELA
ncbi:methylenetetrahydrofolate reductase [Umboniibacter marinipuniceus]|uniref:Methylenetetrahydrofolate reductase n=1 Tax=Umboniibacter marinipuniceus TaxID=569599 RepID=A0A3M0A6S0_9GAMM|nr:5,10-methylenetetrahydrofolate reductase (NAD(P)) [Umboniibacter marinipuniceus]